MKPTKHQILFAEDWLARVWISGVVISVTAGLLVRFLPLFKILGFSLHSVGLAVALVMGALVGYFGSLVLGSCFLPPIYRWREHVNGAPFHAGDLVEILSKPRRGKMARVRAAGDPFYGVLVTLVPSDPGSEEILLALHKVRKSTGDEPCANHRDS